MTVTQKIPSLFAVLIGAVFVGILLVLISWGAEVLTPIMVAGFMAALAAPLYFWLQKRNVSSTLSLVILIVVLVAAVLALAGLLYMSANRFLTALGSYQAQVEGAESAISDLLSSFGITQSTLTDAFSGEKLTALLVAIVGGAASFVGDLLFGLVLVCFLLVDSKRLFGLAETHLSDRPFFGQLPAIAKTVVTYFGVRTTLNLFTGIGFGILLLILGVDYAILWGILAFVLSYVPYIGLFTAMIPPTILALGESGIVYAAIVVIGALVINLAIENVIEPRFTGKVLSLSPVIVIISFFFWGWLLGPTGALLSMPITVMLMLVTAEDPRTQWIAQIIGTGDSDAPEEKKE